LLNQLLKAVIIFRCLNPLFEIGIPGDDSDLVYYQAVTLKGEHVSDLVPRKLNSMPLSCAFRDFCDSVLIALDSNRCRAPAQVNARPPIAKLILEIHLGPYHFKIGQSEPMVGDSDL
jgi:hypothetical protein